MPIGDILRKGNENPYGRGTSLMSRKKILFRGKDVILDTCLDHSDIEKIVDALNNAYRTGFSEAIDSCEHFMS